MQIIDLPTIKRVLRGLDLMPLIESGFQAYSAGQAIVPPIGELLMEKGEVHIKYGCIAGDPYYVIKIASSFHGNHSQGLPPGNGLMLLFSQETGAVIAALHDEAYLTDVRTAVAGAIAAKYLAPESVSSIGIVGTGVQARLQLSYLKGVTECREALVWGRSAQRLSVYAADMADSGFRIETTTDLEMLADRCNLIVTTTASTAPLLRLDHIRPGTHLSAMGSDTPDKQELDPAILAGAQVVVADSIEQCRLRGEISQALRAKQIDESGLLEIGDIIAGRAAGRGGEDQITVFDSTGVAVQDIAVARAVYEAVATTRTLDSSE